MERSIGSYRLLGKSSYFQHEHKLNTNFYKNKTKLNHSFYLSIKKLMIMLPLHGQNTAAL